MRLSIGFSIEEGVTLLFFGGEGERGWGKGWCGGLYP